MQGFFGIGDVDLSIDEIELETRLEENYFSIACDSFGNFIVIGLKNWKLGKIYFCDYEKGYKAKYLTRSFQDFFKCCESEEIRDASRRSIKNMNADCCAIDWEIFERKIKQKWKIYHMFRFEEAGKQ